MLSMRMPGVGDFKAKPVPVMICPSMARTWHNADFW
jgi:hypothetical protein